VGNRTGTAGKGFKIDRRRVSVEKGWIRNMESLNRINIDDSIL
jgi:hypothetical protein